MEDIQQVAFGVKRFPHDFRVEITDYPEFQAILITSGRLELTAGGDTSVASSDHAVLLPFKSDYALTCRKGPCLGWSVTLRGELRRDYDEGRPCVVKADDVLQQLHMMMRRELAERHGKFWVVTEGLAIAFARTVQKLAQQRFWPLSDERTAGFWADEVCSRIEQNLYSGLTTRRLMNTIGLSYSQLVRHFKKIMGATPKQYYLSRRIGEARRLLAQTNASITSIAMELGFSSSQHFSMQFKRFIKETPAEFRRHNGKHARTAS